MNLAKSLEIATGMDKNPEKTDGFMSWYDALKEVIEDKTLSVKVLDNIAHQCGYSIVEFIRLGVIDNE